MRYATFKDECDAKSELQDAFVRGQLRDVQRYLALPHVVEELTAFEALMEASERPNRHSDLPSWFLHYKFIATRDAEPTDIDILQWLFHSRDAAATVTTLPHTLGYLLRVEWLPHASEHGHLETIELLLSSWVFCDQLSPAKQVEILTEAMCVAKDAATAELFLAHGADPHEVSREIELRSLVFSKPHRFASPDCVRTLVANSAYFIGNTSIIREEIHASCSSEFIGELINMGADPTRALNFAVRRKRFDIAELLITEGMVDVDELDRNRTPMITAITNAYATQDTLNAVDYVEMLIRHGADVNGRGDPPICAVAWDYDRKIMELLLRHGSNPDAELVNETPLSILCKRGSRYLDGMQLLLQYGANVNHQDSSGQAPLHCLAKEADCYKHVLGAMKALVAQGGDLDLEDIKGRTPLSMLSNINGKTRWIDQLRAVQGKTSDNLNQ